MPRSFVVDDESLKKLHEWDNTHPIHKNCKGKYCGATGNEYTWAFTTCSIGTVLRIICGRCKEVIDVTDYDSW